MPEPVQISIANEFEQVWCAQTMAENDPWLKYRFSLDTCLRILQWPGSTLFVGKIKGPVGFLLLHPRGFLGCPYIAVIAVVADLRGRGIGAKLLEFAEGHFSNSRHVYLCVSSFNSRARQFYERHGYVRVGELPDFIANGHSELLMQKRLS
jgi:ribosomal protein S18 acetylase RimI-like enzyme